MKQTIKFIAIIALSAVVAFGIGVGVLALTGSANAFVSVSIFGAIAIALAMGAFDAKGKKQSVHDTIRHRSGIKYNNAAILVGGACLFMGTPAECEKLCDDLWHRGVQAEVAQLTGNEETFNVL